MKQTIFALASAQGRAGVAVVRLSGPRALEAVGHLTDKVLQPRHASYTPLIYQGELIDQAVVLWFKAPHSFTGEECVELHVHGARAILDRLYAILTELGLKLAGPGEFSRRALENGKLDLTQAEAIADLVDAETEAQRRQALTQLGGGLKAQYEQWRAELLDLLARLEVYIDFPDEDLPDELAEAIRARIDGLALRLGAAVSDAQRGRQIREGYRIVILGEPNAGKSSLFNALLKAEAAIVTPIAGTTRDIIEAQLRVGPYSVLLYDTAGLRETAEPVEAEGIRRARAKADEADLRIWVIDATNPALPDDWRHEDLMVFNKLDEAGEGERAAIAGLRVSRETSLFAVSVALGQGLEDCVAAIEERVGSALANQTFPAATRQRHIDRLNEARDQLQQAARALSAAPELSAENVRSALASFDALFGRYDVEGVLDIIFSTFCIGK
ncbi:tRNA uridine-5-carboxymethylaminomethyl(34) synthesis GTPase MnmE [Asticcacaulis sp. EMRT-3]|uniref:tRNA uridine-5-carboxymethylaminomethyl(34) synthesis GTPase MnmE n=1 Tax=Asticcacaulis sp. EMRT-3 TaxID=3040349 RepID=UPI0024AEF74D|nr:tRNA uridine-5-carboxymethylaminomethyl(34) synthesis GTPase MnmE [Asticcacaulis sp. EMRT-3]MDI7775820.1 tRNA uridine-5-carboxymethylaminomethyl(34) synthesis GTPase MnmE [Asticcacaulis sp. EMRT-3]